MSIRVPSARCAVLWLAALLCLAAASRSSAKPPDLPLPVHDNLTPDHQETSPQSTLELIFVPFVEPIAVPIEVVPCPESKCDHCPCPCCPFSWGHTIAALFRHFLVPMASGPFGRPSPQAGAEEAAEQPVTPGACYLAHPPKYAPESPPFPFVREIARMRVETSNEECAQPESCEMLPIPPAEVEALPIAPREMPSRKSENGARMRKAREYMIAAEFYTHLGYPGSACEYYEKVCKLCPGSRCGREAAARLQALCASMTRGTEEAAEETPPAADKPGVLPQASYLFERGEALVCAGHIDRACDLFEEVLLICPGHQFARMAQKRLDNLESQRTRKYPVPENNNQVQFQAIPQQVFTAYDVSEVMRHVTGNNVQNHELEAGKAHQLMRMIQGAVQPRSWEARGGQGGIDYNPAMKSLVVRNTEAVQQQVATMLENLRQMQAARRNQQPTPPRGAEEASAAADQRPAGEPEPPQVVAMGYKVSDLLCAYEVEWTRKTDTLSVVRKQDAEARVAELVRLIENGIAPDSWHSRGGPGRIEYNPAMKTFFIMQTPEVQEAITEMLQVKWREMKLHKKRCEKEVEKSKVKKESQKKVDEFNWIDFLPPYERDIGAAFSAAAIGVAVAREAAKIDCLLEKCHAATLTGRHTEAVMLVRQALTLNRDAVMAHPLVYKMQLMSQVFGQAESLKPRMPGIDPGVVRAYTEILEMAPPQRFHYETHEATPVCPAGAKEQKPAVLEVQEEACELEIVTDGNKIGPTVCFEKDKDRLRLQVQFGAWTFKLMDEGKGKQSLSLTVGVIGGGKKDKE